MAPLSPMMQQYFQIKEQHKNHILFYRIGDFYEMFYDDAITASRELELVLTGKECGQEERAPMCGVPYHSCESYIARLIKKGYKVAVCEQTEDPKTAKGLVKREVVRVYTPGTLIESNMLEEGANNYIASVFCAEDQFGAAFADVSTGRAYVTEIPMREVASLQNELSRFSPSEIVYNEAFCGIKGMGAFLRERIGCCAQALDEELCSNTETLLKVVLDQFGETVVRKTNLFALYLFFRKRTNIRHMDVDRLKNILRVLKEQMYFLQPLYLFVKLTKLRVLKEQMYFL